MIHFKSCKWENFLSTGNDPITILLDRSPTTLIVGQNGAGKSTLLDALSFVLFNKPHRDINKNQLINSINGKKTLVEVEFDVGASNFKVVRGIKPARFEIWQNGNMINQSSNARDYQKFLEQNILKLNHKSFHQVVVLGSSSFIPFMQLPAWSRRSVIEDLLDINIFSKMNTLLKERNSKIKDELVDINHRIDLLKTKITGQNKYIKDLQSLNQDQIDNKKDSIEVHKTDIKATFEESKKLGENLETLLKEEDKRYRTNNEELSTFRSLDLQHASGIKDLVKESRFYEDNDHCPTCDQDIELEKKNEKQSQIKSKAAQIQTDKTILAKQIEDAQAELQDIQNRTNQLRQKQQKINSNNDKITLLQKEIDKIQKEIGQLTSATGDVSKAKQDLNNSRKSKEDITEKKLEYVEERTYNEVIGEMLKDTGIKTKVIKQYLPVMNRLINQYLQILDFFVAFHLDENFNETIRSRHRDSFNYSSFSEGEKQRIDLSLLFTWRQIAKLKNSAATNLLVLDETFDSSLDADGVESLTKILGTLEEGSNVFIISHKGDILENKFRSKIEFFKEKNFSKIK
jgi:DNA repair exonuclease SbcCD ATPase subunit|tara:strand:- start:4531 stop:6246 length:1716 start_codon:yes stop_codon:yes gene_type:complete